MAMYLKNDDLEFLKKVHKDLDDVSEYVEDAERLFNLIQTLQEQRYRDRQKTANAVRKKRSKNPEYGRSKPEIERMRKKMIDFIIGTGGEKK